MSDTFVDAYEPDERAPLSLPKPSADRFVTEGQDDEFWFTRMLTAKWSLAGSVLALAFGAGMLLGGVTDGVPLSAWSFWAKPGLAFLVSVFAGWRWLCTLPEAALVRPIVAARTNRVHLAIPRWPKTSRSAMADWAQIFGVLLTALMALRQFGIV